MIFKHWNRYWSDRPFRYTSIDNIITFMLPYERVYKIIVSIEGLDTGVVLSG